MAYHKEKIHLLLNKQMGEKGQVLVCEISVEQIPIEPMVQSSIQLTMKMQQTESNSTILQSTVTSTTVLTFKNLGEKMEM